MSKIEKPAMHLMSDIVNKPMPKKILLGVDAGGTHTRVLVTDTNGFPIGYFIGKGSNPEHGPDACDNAHDAIHGAVRIAGCSMADIAGLVVGQAGLNDVKDQEWAKTHTALPGISCSRIHVNDAVVAHVGAMQSHPGIIAISGTGSIVFGITDSGRHIRNYDFGHYANSAASQLGKEVVETLISLKTVDGRNANLVQQACSYWRVEDIDEFRRLAIRNFDLDSISHKRHLSSMAPLVTEAAVRGSPLAQFICQEAARTLLEGISLVSSCFSSFPIQIALIGSVAQSAYMNELLTSVLSRDTNYGFTICQPVLSPEAGAAIMALEAFGTKIEQKVIDRLSAAPSVNIS